MRDNGNGGGGGAAVHHTFLQNDQKNHHDHRFLKLHNFADHHHQEKYCKSIGNEDGDDANFHDEEKVEGYCSSIKNDEPFNGGDDDQQEEEEDSMERTMFWESQEALLEEILEQHKSSYPKLREELIKHIESAKKARFCDCLSPNLDDCSICLRRQVVNLLCKKGFNATLCTSSWKKTDSIPGGKHEYIEVVVSTQGKKRKVKFLIEIEFQDEFKMAKACDEYQNLVNLLPQTYIGKFEHLNAILRVMCDAAKRSTAEKKIHLGPWRKRSFMQMKWSASSSSPSSPSSTRKGLKEQEEANGAKSSNLSVPAGNIAVRVA